MSYLDTLSSLDNAYAAAAANDPGRLPDGRYICVLQKAELREKEGRLRLFVTWQVAEGEHAGRKIFDGQRIAPDSLGYLKAYLEKLGLALERLSLLEQAITTLPGTMVQLSLAASQRDSRYQNCYLNRYLGRQAPPAIGTAGSAPGGNVTTAPGTPLPDGFTEVGEQEDLPF